MCSLRLRNKGKLVVISLLICKAFLSNTVFAAGFQLNEVSPSLQGSANAGAAATSNDVSAMFSNPATLSTLLHNQAYLGVSAILPDVRMTDATAVHTVNVPGFFPVAITAPISGTTSQGSVASSALVPDAFLSWRIKDNLVAGIALTTPFGLTTTYSNTSVLRFAAQKSELITFNINPAMALQLNNQWAIGGGLQFQYARAIFSNFDGPYTGIPAIDAFIAANRPTKFYANGWGYGATVGVLFTPWQCTRLGIGYRSKIVQDLSGHGQQFVGPGPTVPAPSPDFLFNAETTVYGSVNMPAVLTLSAVQNIENWTLKASAQLNFWSSFKHLSINSPDAFATNATIQAHWQNVWLFALGAEYRLCDWIFRAGTAYDQTPTSNRYRDPRIPDANRWWLTVGSTYQFNKNFSIDGVYEHIFGQNVNVNTTQAFGSNAISGTVPLEVNQISAKYRTSVDIIGLALRYSFC